MHYYQFNIGDYRKDTGHLTLLEHGIYRSLIDSYYLNEGGLLADDAKLMRTHSIRTAIEQESYKSVISDFFSEQNGYYINGKCESTMGKIFEKSQKARESAQKRWEKNANAMRTHKDSNANGMLPNNPLPNNPIKTPYQLIVDAYHECLPNFPKVIIISAKRKSAIKKLWNYENHHQDIDWWKDYFAEVNKSDFLSGRLQNNNDNHNTWKCDFEFLININNFVKILEGKYK